MKINILIRPDGKALVTAEKMVPEQMALLQKLWKDWLGDPDNHVLIIGNAETEMRIVTDIEIDLKEGK